MRIKRGDLLPALTATLTDTIAGVVTPVNLTTATSIRVIGRRESATVNLFDRAVTGGADGKVTMAWQAGDTSVSGRIYIEVEVMWPGSKPQTFPPSSQLVVRVEDDLG